MKVALSDLKAVAYFWAVLVFWRALRETARVLRKHLGKELIVAAVLFGLAFLLKEKSPFVDELRNSLFLLLIAAGGYGGLVFLWQFAMAPIRLERELDQEREKILHEATAAMTHAGRIDREYGSNIIHTPSPQAIHRQLGTELREIRRKIEIVQSTRPHPHYSDGFQLPNARFDQYDETLAENEDLYAVVEKAYTAAHHVNEALQMRKTRATPGMTIGVTPDDGLDAAYDAAGKALDALNESRGEPFESAVQRAARKVTEDILADTDADS